MIDVTKAYSNGDLRSMGIPSSLDIKVGPHGTVRPTVLQDASLLTGPSPHYVANQEARELPEVKEAIAVPRAQGPLTSSGELSIFYSRSARVESLVSIEDIRGTATQSDPMVNQAIK